MDGKKLNEIEQSMKELQEASQKLRMAGLKLYASEKSDADINIFRKLMEAAYKINPEKAQKIEEMIRAEEPDIENKKDQVQKLVISGVLINHLYKLKAEDENIDIMPLLMAIPYYADEEGWLDCMIDYTIPLLFNNDAI